MGSGSDFGALGSLELSWGPGPRSWRLAGSKPEGTAHSEDMAKAEAREPRALADCLPGPSPDGASCRAMSTNPHLSRRARGAWHRGRLSTCHPSLRAPGPHSLQRLTLPVRHLAGTFRTTASLVTWCPLKARLSPGIQETPRAVLETECAPVPGTATAVQPQALSLLATVAGGQASWTQLLTF